jgi:L-methionine (R)-S-oxide reductase
LPPLIVRRQLQDQFSNKMTFQLTNQISSTKSELYSNLTVQLRALLEGERDAIANMANVASLVFYSLPDLNWAGFYLLKNNELVLGPFQGKPACVRIRLGEGVCGTAAQRRETILVDNVHDFPGHIACDSASNSEVVVPIVAGARLIGVLDVDSPSLARFDDEDARGLNELVRIFIEATDLGLGGYS